MNRSRPPLHPAEAWTALALGVEPSRPAPGLRDRILAAAGRAAPYRAQLPDFARCFDLPEAAVHRLLERMADPAAWSPGFGATLAYLHFEAGPGLASPGAASPPHCGVTRMRHGARIPLHVHKARERTFVLSGELVDGEGRRFGPGEVLEAEPGSRHSLTVHGAPEALMAVLLADIEIVQPP
jgi:hypothetical protein